MSGPIRQGFKGEYHGNCGFVMRIRLMLSVLGLALFFAGAPAHAQLAGTDIAPGATCLAAQQGRSTLVADANGDNRGVVLICNGSNWVAAGQTMAPANPPYSVQFNSGGSLVAPSLPGTVYIYNGMADLTVGIGALSTSVPLFVTREIRFGYTNLGCTGATEGALRYNSVSGNVYEYCNGTAWSAFGVGAARNSWDRKAGIFAAQAVASACGILNNGQTYCWGSNNTYGHQGNGSTSTATFPTLVVGGHNFKSIESYSFHSLAIRDDGAGYSFGYGGNASLGHGGTGSRTSPSTISGGYRWRNLSPGGNHSCGIRDDGDAYCWGNSGSGVICGVSGGHKYTPEPVAGGYKFREVSGGWLFNCGLRDNGSAYCWGSDSVGQRGDGAGGGSCPYAVAGGHVFTTVSVGYDHACGIADNGDAYCWGNNSEGQLGNNSTGTSTSPVLVQGGHKFRSITAGGYDTCGVTVGGALYCWGSYAVSTGFSGGGDRLVPEAVALDYGYGQHKIGGANACGIAAATGVGYCMGQPTGSGISSVTYGSPHAVYIP